MEEISNFSWHDKEFLSQDISLNHEVLTKLEEIYNNILGRQELALGYPINQKFDYSYLAPFLNFHLNNVGDPYAARSMLLHTHDLEQEVLNYFSQLWHAVSRTPLTSDSFWGYVLGMGATEGNMYALWSAREYLLDESDKSMRIPLLYFSNESHYSIEKCAKITGIKTFYEFGNQCYPGQCPITEDGYWPRGIPVDKHGAINPELLSTLVDFFSKYGHPSIIVLNLGTTFRGGFDNPLAVWKKLSHIYTSDSSCLQLDDRPRRDCWIHIDGALGAAYLPYLEMACDQGLINKKGPCFDFRLTWVNSIVMSSHKWYGAPFASGIYMSKEKYRMKPATLPEYIDSPDTTLCGSRNGLSVLMLWCAVRNVPPSIQVEIAANCIKLADYAFEQLIKIKEVHHGFYVDKGPQSLTILFTRPNKDIFNKFQLSGQDDYAHIVIMPHVTRSAIDNIVELLHSPDAFENK